jgi:hypothetical protein
MDNIEQFSLYTVKILDELYKKFPIKSSLCKEDIINEYLNFDKDEDIKQLSLKNSFIDIVEMIDTKDDCELTNLEEKFKTVKPELEENLRSLKQEKQDEVSFQSEIYSGTLDFLISEGLIKNENDLYQLTSKSFSHLNKKFTSNTIESVDGTYISAIKSLFEKSSNIPIGIATGTATKILTGILGY